MIFITVSGNLLHNCITETSKSFLIIELLPATLHQLVTHGEKLVSLCLRICNKIFGIAFVKCPKQCRVLVDFSSLALKQGPI